ncbi:RNA polymerase sigma factor [Aquincola sp. S2]|uniref:RNA polymerase sigma factor n=2 Tax=Pseudaquabacterium terrae TaxID=2732868 RepID=A0ABX2E9G1_9BURK|nr:RNA polymerase sigma factor [Aquabacterium terrae]NRF65363.1 RNA polymerase sigma factor [Aquabacterium terrae]
MTPLPAPLPAPEPETDAGLAARAAGGDTLAFELIMRRNNRLLFRTARSILKSDAEAEDALQDTYLKAWRGLGGFRADAKLSTWLVRIVSNEALARLRPRSAQVISLEGAMDDTAHAAGLTLPDDPDRQPDRAAMRAELRRLMEARIDRLPDVFRTVFVLRAVEEWKVEEIAAALAIPEATVRTRFFRARSLLREALSCDIDVAIADAFSFDGARCDRIVCRVLASLADQPAADPS